VRDGASTALEIARPLWSAETAETQPVLVIWEVLGHLDLLVNRGTVRGRTWTAGGTATSERRRRWSSSRNEWSRQRVEVAGPSCRVRDSGDSDNIWPYNEPRPVVAAFFAQMTMLDANGLELFVQEDGPAVADNRAPVVMLHGCARNGNIWSGWIPALSEKYRVLRPDIRGCGASGDPGPDYVFEVDDMVSDLIEILDGLGIREVHHIGESTGGIVGAIAAARYPERFRSLTLVSTPIAPANGNLEVKAPGAASPEEAFTKLGLKQWWLQSRALTGDLFGDDRDEVIATDFARTPLHVALSMWTAMHRPDVTIEPYLSRLTMPTLVLTPTASYTMTPEAAARHSCRRCRMCVSWSTTRRTACSICVRTSSRATRLRSSKESSERDETARGYGSDRTPRRDGGLRRPSALARRARVTRAVHDTRVEASLVRRLVRSGVGEGHLRITVQPPEERSLHQSGRSRPPRRYG